MTAVRTLFLAAILGVGFAGVAHARGGAVFTATLEAPAQESRVIVQNAIWDCSADTCVARPNHAATVRSCRQFVRESGARVTAYGSPERQLTSEELSRCNGDASVQQARN